MGASEPGPLPPCDVIAVSAPRLAVEVVRRAREWDGAVDDELIERAAAAAHAAARGEGPAEVSILLGGDADIRALNKDWRGRDEATNVLSFPLDAPHFGGGPRPLGDVALAYGTVEREARARGIPLGHHAAHLVVHGVLHLMGHDHRDDTQARVMESLEARVLAGLGVPDPYAADMTIDGEAR